MPGCPAAALYQARGGPPTRSEQAAPATAQRPAERSSGAPRLAVATSRQIDRRQRRREGPAQPRASARIRCLHDSDGTERDRARGMKAAQQRRASSWTCSIRGSSSSSVHARPAQTGPAAASRTSVITLVVAPRTARASRRAIAPIVAAMIAPVDRSGHCQPWCRGDST